MRENYILRRAVGVILSILALQACDVKEDRKSQGDDIDFGDFVALDVQVEDENFANCIAAQAAISGWTQSTEVTSLNCDNSKIISIVGIEQFDALSDLSLRNNLLAKIDISELNLLKSLDLGLNRIQTLNFESNMLLRVLRIDNNLFQNLDLSAQGSLKELDISANSGLLTIQFPVSTILETLIADELTAFDFQLFDFTLHPRLKTLSLNNNFLEEIDLTGNLLLTELRLAGNLLEFDDLDFLFSPNFIKTLDLSNNLIVSDDIDTFYFDSGIYLSSLNLSNNFISQIDLSNCEYITDLDLSNNYLASLNLSSCIPLKSLKVSDNNLLTEIDISANTSLETLDASNNFLTFFDDYRLTHQNLKSINLLDNNLETIDQGPTRSNLILLQASGVEVLYD